MQDVDAIAIQFDLQELAAWDSSHSSQAAALARIQEAAVCSQVVQILLDPAGRALAVATTDGVLHMLDSPVLPPEAARGKLRDDVTVPEPGFHADRTQTFYVTPGRRVFRLRAPGLWATLQPVPALPDNCEEVDVDGCDPTLCALAECADALEEEGADAGRVRAEELEAVDSRRPRADGGRAMISYARVDDVVYQIAVAADGSVAVSSATAGRHFRPHARGRWDGAQLVGVPRGLAAGLRRVIELAIRQADEVGDE